ncbi:MAG: hypothetical protein ACYTFG_08345 [Planctomycetota bacterium]|jgi:hypothetical protein
MATDQGFDFIKSIGKALFLSAVTKCLGRDSREEDADCDEAAAIELKMLKVALAE